MGIRRDISLAHTPEGKPVLFCDTCGITLKSRLTPIELMVYTDYRKIHTCYGILHRNCPDDKLAEERKRRISITAKFKQKGPERGEDAYKITEDIKEEKTNDN